MEEALALLKSAIELEKDGYKFYMEAAKKSLTPEVKPEESCPSVKDVVEISGPKQRKKKRSKKRKKWGGLWKLTPLMEIRKKRGFPQRLEKDFAKNAQLFHSSAQGPTAITLNRRNLLTQ